MNHIATTLCRHAVRASRTGAMAVLVWLLVAGSCMAGDIEFHPPARATDPSTVEVMRDLAVRVVPVYQDNDARRFLANVAALQMAARNYTAATVNRRLLEERRSKSGDRRSPDDVILDVYAKARAMEAERGVDFPKALAQAYHEIVGQLGDHEAYAVASALMASPSPYADELDAAFDRQRSRDTIGIDAAVNLIWKYLAFDARRSISPYAAVLDAQDEANRYVVDNGVQLTGVDQSEIRIVVVRPRAASGKLASLLEFNIDPGRNSARECAAHGFAGVVATVERVAHGRRAPAPFERDAAQVTRVLDWIARQPWSDGRVGMYGDRYSGFAAWAGARHPSRALRAIATSATTAPGIDAPMAGSIFQNSAYRWSLYVTNTDPAAVQNFYDDGIWRELDRTWYRSGRRYRDLGALHGKPSPIFIRWLNHPSYDAYWQNMIPYREQFARIDIPVLTITGYFAGSEPGALYYFTQHHRYKADARHTLLIGPYDDAALQRGPLRRLQSYEVDEAAVIDLRELRYQWFEHVLKDGPLPAPLKDRVNYEVMGANEWRSAGSIAAMADRQQRFYLDAGSAAGDQHALVARRPTRDRGLRQIVDLKDRSDAAWTPPMDFVSRSLAARNSLVFVSRPFEHPVRLNGLFSGRLEMLVNKMDVDLNISLFELTPAGDYIQLFSPTLELRASYARDRRRRHLLQAGVPQHIEFQSERLTSRQFSAGSRLVLLLGIARRPDREINYGTGNDVSEESFLDADEPYRLRWLPGSYIEVPVSR